MATTEPAKLDYADPVAEAINGLARFSEFYADLGQELAAAGKLQSAEEYCQQGKLVWESLETQLADRPNLLSFAYGRGAVTSSMAGQSLRTKELCRKLQALVTPCTASVLNDLS